MRALIGVLASALLVGGAAAQQPGNERPMGFADEWVEWPEIEVVERADWSELSAAEAIAEVSEALAGINRAFLPGAPFIPTHQGSTGPYLPPDPGSVVAMAQKNWMDNLMDDAIQQVVAIRDNLAGNPYVRVSAFTVSIPCCIAVEFSFPPTDAD